ncbi:NUDIX hydrolase (plasmid) [Carnobacterium sp. 17-4]|uniref:NUDIX hydrolase n=1 Tax=Carnobacterium sp. (strain 17-4) TaxID=208596 RepID=UPI0002058494|nr:NUDIX hydrolase [Carnobacterium sp. 17-4]AEB31198.1 NUDIX hydrolase [Carnobacterium sp. 17-4]
MKRYHTAFGIYGILYRQGKLLVIKKTGGPYIYRFDLPGGSQEFGERLEDTLIREIKEETNLIVTDFHQLGVVNFIYPWSYKNTTMTNHIATFYEIDSFVGRNLEQVDQFSGQDSAGSVWLPLNELTEENSSLLVLKAKEYIQEGTFIDKGWILDKWKILDSPVY